MSGDTLDLDGLTPDRTAPVVELTDTDLGVVASVHWPHLAGTGSTDPSASHDARFPERVFISRLVDTIREHCPTAEVWWPAGGERLAIRQDRADVVARPGDTLHMIAGEVTR